MARAVRGWWRRFLKGGLSRRSLAGLSILVTGAVLLFALGAIIFINARNLSENIVWTQHTDDVLFAAMTAHDDLLEMQSAVRAYALTGDKVYTQGLAEHRDRLDAGMRRLADMVADNPAQANRLISLRALVAERVARLVSFMNLDQAAQRQRALGGAEAAALRVSAASLTGRIEAGFAAFRAVEQGLLQERQARTLWWTHFLNALAMAVAVMAPILGAVGILLLWSEDIKSRATELMGQLARAQRLSLMGETATTLAHEIKQPLTAAQNYLAVLRRLEPTERQSDLIQRVSAQVMRADAIIQRLRGFIEERPVSPQSVTPENLVADAVLLVHTIDSAILLGTQIAGRPGAVWADPIQIEQVLVNLMRNAIEAMRGRPGQTLDLSVRRNGAGMIQFCLADNGPGVPPEVVSRLFEPGRSTKPGGMGVGLSICRKIITAHGGEIWAEAAPGGGAQFCFTLPPAPAHATQAA